MTPTEAVALCRVVRAYAPQQPMDEYTADAYGDLLGDFPFGDCREAVKKLGQTQTWISPADIHREVRAVRAKRIADAGTLCPPPDLTEAEERAWLGAERRRIGDGLPPTPDPRELVARKMPDLRRTLAAPPRADQ